MPTATVAYAAAEELSPEVWTERVRATLAALGSPDPETDMRARSAYVKRARDQGIAPQVAAGIVFGMIHGRPERREDPTRYEPRHTFEDWAGEPGSEHGRYRGIPVQFEPDARGALWYARAVSPNGHELVVTGPTMEDARARITWEIDRRVGDAWIARTASGEDALPSAKRARLPDSAFALPERRALPIHDAAHVRAAAARLSMMRHQRHVTRAEHERAHARIAAAGKKFGVEVTEPVWVEGAHAAACECVVVVAAEASACACEVCEGAQKLESGYAQVARGDLVSIKNDDWEIRVITPRGDEYQVGSVRIDDVMHRVWWSPALQANVAQVQRGDVHRYGAAEDRPPPLPLGPQPPPEPHTKPLVWHKDGDEYVAKTPLGDFRVARAAGPRGAMTMWAAALGEWSSGPVDTKDDAYKASARHARNPSGQPRQRAAKPAACGVAIVERTPDCVPKGVAADTAAEVFAALAPKYARQGRETIDVVLVSKQGEMVGSPVEIVSGQTARVVVDVEQILGAVLLGTHKGATAAWVVHAHPSGHASASPSDRDLTKRIKAGWKHALPSTDFKGHLVCGAKSWVMA